MTIVPKSVQSSKGARVTEDVNCQTFCHISEVRFVHYYDEGVIESMKEATKRSIFRWIHVIISIPIIGYIYSPFEEIPNYAPAVRFVFLPTMVLTGFWMWKGHVIRRLVWRIGKLTWRPHMKI